MHQNLVGATTRLKELVLAQLPSAVDRAWVSEYVGFADCAVDRIVPPFDAARLSPASSPRGSPEPEPTAPALDVAVEAFHEWAVDGTQLRSPAPRVKGWTRTPRLRAFVERKLYTLNTAHAIAAYRGALAGLDTVGAAIADPAIEAAVRQALAESGAALCAEHGFTEEEHAAYIEKTIQRFRNPHLHDAIARVAREPLRKLARADRLVGPARMCAARGIPARGLLSGVAAALLYDAPDDAQSAQLARDIATKGLERTVVDVTGFEAGGDEVREVVEAYERLSAERA
jgi:mannitol-1-phosphate 5-dehydrogenase